MPRVVVPQAAVLPTFGDPEIVGVPPQWGDNHDSTYVLLTSTRDAGLHLLEDQAGVDLQAASYPGVPEFSIRMKGRIEESSNDEQVELAWQVIGDPFTLIGDVTRLGTTAGTEFDITYEFTASDYNVWDAPDRGFDSSAVKLRDDLAAGSARLGAGIRPGLSAFPVYRRVVTLYELQLLAHIPTGSLPPTRLFPRDDGRGMSAGTRVWPPPKSQQGGSRVGPGSYW